MKDELDELGVTVRALLKRIRSAAPYKIGRELVRPAEIAGLDELIANDEDPLSAREREAIPARLKAERGLQPLAAQIIERQGDDPLNRLPIVDRKDDELELFSERPSDAGIDAEAE